MKKLLSFLLIVCAFAAVLSFTACKKKTVKVSEYDINVTYDSQTRTLTGVENFTYYNDTDNEISVSSLE